MKTILIIIGVALVLQIPKGALAAIDRHIVILHILRIPALDVLPVLFSGAKHRAQRRFQRLCRDLRAPDVHGNRLVVNLFLHFSHAPMLPSGAPRRCRRQRRHSP